MDAAYTFFIYTFFVCAYLAILTGMHWTDTQNRLKRIEKALEIEDE